jgi:hypothetical protein
MLTNLQQQRILNLDVEVKSFVEISERLNDME